MLTLPACAFSQEASSLLLPSDEILPVLSQELHSDSVSLHLNLDYSARVVPGGYELLREPLHVPYSEARFPVYFPEGKDGTLNVARVLTDRVAVVSDQTEAFLRGLKGSAKEAELVERSGTLCVLKLPTPGDAVNFALLADKQESVRSATPLLARQLHEKQAPQPDISFQWYFDNDGLGASVASADANLIVDGLNNVDAYNFLYTNSSREEQQINVAGGDGVKIAVVDNGIAPIPSLYNPADGDDESFLNDWFRPSEARTPRIPSVAVTEGLNLNLVSPNSAEEALPRRSGQNHGTLVSAIIGGDRNADAPGIAYNSTLVPIRLTVDLQTPEKEAAALTHNLDDEINSALDIDIYNNSWGENDESTILTRLPIMVAEALEEGISMGRKTNVAGVSNMEPQGAIYVFPAGNGAQIGDNSNYDGYANSPYTIAVGAFNDFDSKHIDSEPGTNLVISAPASGGERDIIAPGFRVLSEGSIFDNGILFDLEFELFELPSYDAVVSNSRLLYPDAVSDYDVLEGTSAATPIVSSVVALMLEARSKTFAGDSSVLDSDLTWRDVQDILITEARMLDPLDPDWKTNAAGLSFNDKYGAGAVDAFAAVRMAGQKQTLLGPREVEIDRKTYGQSGSARTLIQDAPSDAFIESFQIGDGTAETNLRVEHVVLEVTTFKGRFADLDVTLYSPNGTPSRLARSRPSQSDERVIQFPFMTTHNWGEGSNGEWTVVMRDRVRGGRPVELGDMTLKVYGSLDPAAPVTGAPALISDRIIRGTQGQPIGTVPLRLLGSVSSVRVENLPEGLAFIPANQTADGQPAITGTPVGAGLLPFQIILGGANGTTTQNLVAFIEPVVSSLGAAVEQDGRSFFSGGDVPWVPVLETIGSTVFVDTTDGLDALQSSPRIDDNQSSVFGFSNVGKGVVLFDWKVSSEVGEDRLWVNCGGDAPENWKAFIDGEVPFGRVAVPLPRNSNTVQWIYKKSLSDSGGGDVASLDQIEFLTNDQYLGRIEGNGSIINGSPTRDEDGVITVPATEPYFAPIVNEDIVTDSRTLWVPVETDLNGSSSSVLRTPSIGDGQRVALSTLWNAGPATLSFDFTVNSEELDEDGNGDFLAVFVDGIPVGGSVVEVASGSTTPMAPFRASGVVPLSTATVEIPAIPDAENGFKTRLIQIVYTKDISSVANGDFATLNNVLLVPNVPLATVMNSAADADDDADGFTNLQEAVFGGNPAVADIPQYLPKVVTINGGTMVEITIDKRFTDQVDYQLQRSETMEVGSWEQVPLSDRYIVRRGAQTTYQLPVVQQDKKQVYYRVNPLRRVN